jgi:dihydrofolate reductase
VTRPLILYVTASLDGFIADREGGVGWLTGAEGEDYGYAEFIAGVDTIVMGSGTYLASLALDGGTSAFAGRATYVFTARDDLPATPGVTFCAEPAIDAVARLKEQRGGAIWLLGGGKLATSLAAAGEIDDVRLFVQPVLLGDGIPLWGGFSRPLELRLVEATAWPGGLAELRYAPLPRA